MAIEAIIFDLDGTLVDTNPGHVEAWYRAFRECGFEVDRDRIRPQTGMGGDMLVPAILGETVEREHGEALRRAYTKAFLLLAQNSNFEVLPGATQLLNHLNAHGIKTAIASSSKQEQLQAIEESAGCKFSAMVDVITTGNDAARSKPEPDIVLAAVEKLQVTRGEAILVGDTPHDAEACRRADVVFVGVTSGGHSVETLRDAGAAAVFSNAAAILADIEALLELQVLQAR